jgi:hypothetical protein
VRHLRAHLFAQVLSLRVEDVEPEVGRLGDGCVAGGQVLAAQELREELRLEELDHLELAAPLELKALELAHLAVKVKDGVALLEEAALRRGRTCGGGGGA